MNIRHAALALALSLALGASGAEIERIETVTTTGEAVSEGLVRSNMKLRSGSAFDPEVLSEDIRRLYATNQFADIEAKFQPTVEGRGKLVLILTLKPRVESIEFQGNAELKTSKLEDKLTQQTAVPVDDAKMAADKAALKELYDKKGFYNARITVRVLPGTKPGLVKVVYVIDERQSVKVDDVVFHGNTVFTQDELDDMMQTQPSFWRYLFGTGFLNETLFDRDRDKITSSYKGRGFFDFKITRVERRMDGKFVELHIHVEEGLAYKLGKVSVSGVAAYPQAQIDNLIAPRSGLSYSETLQKQDIDRITAVYSTDGYLDLRITPVLKTDPKSRVVDVEYKIYEGKPSTIRDVNIIGNVATNENVIRRELALHPGDKSSQLMIDKSKSRLQAMGYFDDVEIIPVETDVEEKRDLQVKVKEGQTGRLMLGAGYSSEDDLVGTIGFSQSNFDIANGWPFIGAGERFRANAEVGTERQSFNIGWTDPWFNGEPMAFGVDLFYNQRYYTDWDFQTFGDEVSLTKRLDSMQPWTLRSALRSEYVTVDPDNDASKRLKDEETDEFVNSPIFTLGRDTRNNLVRPTEGENFSISTELQSEAWASANNLYKLSIKDALYFPVGDESVFKLSGQADTADGLFGDEVPIYERYFGGGIGRIRGFRERRVGSKEAGTIDENKAPLGGQTFAVATAEFDSPIGGPFYWAAFMDVGNVWRNAWEIEPDDLNVTVGPGLRMNLPLGLIQLDYGIPLIKADGQDGNGRLHFSLGYQF
ncbi:MAG: outer membrane protein assembly factor BamA [Verrucomicrobiota bacterium]|jgi:outer membrane protein insertion porin family